MARRTFRWGSPRPIVCVFAIALIAVTVSAQEQSTQKSEPREIQMTAQGMLVLSTPNGWERRAGPGLLFFTKKGVRPEKADVWIYVSECPIGPNEKVKSRDEYIESDAAGFRARFKNGRVQIDESFYLPNAKTSVPVRTFESGESRNAYEQVVYIAEQTRVLTLVLSAKTKRAYASSLTVFHEFVKSYNGSIILAPDSTRP